MAETEENEKEKTKSNTGFYMQIAAVIVLAGLLMFSFGKSPGGDSSFTGQVIETIPASEIIPTGIPRVYGEELKIKYDDISPNNPQLADKTINTLGKIDMSETLTGANFERYVNILYKLENGISCEFCCGARAVIFENGEPACGCAHSYAMRGVLLQVSLYHGDEFTDEEILEEVGKWKVLFFPGIHEGKAQVLKSQGIEINYINLASNKYRGIEKGQASGGMVGGC